jgi:hypothetical protein
MEARYEALVQAGDTPGVEVFTAMLAAYIAVNHWAMVVRAG